MGAVRVRVEPEALSHRELKDLHRGQGVRPRGAVRGRRRGHQGVLITDHRQRWDPVGEPRANPAEMADPIKRARYALTRPTPSVR